MEATLTRRRGMDEPMAKSKRAKKLTMEQRTLSPEDFEKMRVACIWDDCDRSIPSTEMQPPDWHNLLVYWSPYPDAKKTLGDIVMGPSCYRDAVLCPEHAKTLDGLLKDIGQGLRGPSIGTA